MTDVHPLIRFLNRIEGHGYGGAADFEVARTDAQYLLVNLDAARKQIERLRRESQEPRGTCPRCGAAVVGTVTGPQDAEIERLRAALRDIASLRPEDMYRGDDQSQAGYLAKAALNEEQNE